MIGQVCHIAALEMHPAINLLTVGMRTCQPDHLFRHVDGMDLDDGEFAIELSYEGTIPLEEATLADGSTLDEQFKGIGGWIASTLVRLGDLKFEFLPPDPEDD